MFNSQRACIVLFSKQGTSKKFLEEELQVSILKERICWKFVKWLFCPLLVFEMSNIGSEPQQNTGEV